MKNKWLITIIGIYLIIDSFISIYLANVGRITLHLSFISDNLLFFLSQIFRLVRLIIGLLLITYKDKISKTQLIFIGLYLIIDALWSIILAGGFNSWDDWLRVSRAISGILLI